MMMEIHYYDPFDFTLDANSSSWKWGQDRERQKNEGQAYANDIVPKARGGDGERQRLRPGEFPSLAGKGVQEKA